MATYRGDSSKDSTKSHNTTQNKAGYKWINRLCVVVIIIFLVMIAAFSQQYADLLR